MTVREQHPLEKTAQFARAIESADIIARDHQDFLDALAERHRDIVAQWQRADTDREAAVLQGRADELSELFRVIGEAAGRLRRK